MSGRGGRRNNGRGGRGRGGRGERGRGRGRGQNYTGLANTKKKGMCANLGTNVFDYGQKTAADIMRTSWDKLVQYVGTNYGQDISNELQNKIYVDIIEPVHYAEVLRKYGLREAIIQSGQRNIQRAKQAQEKILEAAVLAKDPDAPMKLAILQNEIAQGDFSSSNEVTM
jgi:ribosomal protein L15